MSERTAFEKLTLLCVVVGAVIVVFGTGAVVGGNLATDKLQQAATQTCGAKFDELTGEFAWIECPPPAAEPVVVAPEPEPDPEEPVAPTEAVPPAVETPNEPVH